MVARSFPLLKLPADEVIRTLLLINPVQLLSLSLLSKRAKSIVISCKVKANKIGIYFGDELIIHYYFPSSHIYLEFSMDHGTGPRKIIQKPMGISFFECRSEHPGIWFKWINVEYGVKDWLDHFKCVFNQKETSIVFMQNTFDFNSIYENFKNPTRIDICHSGNYEFNSQVADSILPTKELNLDVEAFENWRVPEKILMQNIDRLKLQGLGGYFKLNEVLCINSREIYLHGGTVTEKDMNTFLKLWKAGSNTRLEKLYIEFPDRGIYDFKGIDYKLVPAEENQQRSFKSRSGETKFLSGEGKDICRFDGIRGTVCDIDRHFHFYVWHDHCIG